MTEEYGPGGAERALREVGLSDLEVDTKVRPPAPDVPYRVRVEDRCPDVEKRPDPYGLTRGRQDQSLAGGVAQGPRAREGEPSSPSGRCKAQGSQSDRPPASPAPSKVNIFYSHGPDRETPLLHLVTEMTTLHKEGKFNEVKPRNANELLPRAS